MIKAFDKMTTKMCLVACEEHVVKSGRCECHSNSFVKFGTFNNVADKEFSNSLKLNNICASIYSSIPSLVSEEEFEEFDEQSGMRYIRKQHVPEPPELNHVLKWHSTDGRNKYSHFEVSKGEAYFLVYDGEEVSSVLWNLDERFLHKQTDELIDFLYDLIKE